MTDVLRKCILLGGHAHSAELRDWARLELDGYRGAEADLPSYRRISAPLLIDGIQGTWMVKRKQISVWDLPDFAQEGMSEGLTIPFGIAELVELARKKDSIDLQPSGGDNLVHYMNNYAAYNIKIERMYYAANPTAILGILDAVRTKLIALTAELQSADRTPGGLPTPAAADQAVQVVIKGFARANVAVGDHATVTTHTPPTESRIPSWIRGPWAVLIGVSTVAGALAAAAAVGWPPFH